MKNRHPDTVFEDADYVFINKPPGLLTIPDRFDVNAPSLYQILTERFHEIYIVHRLDKDTSGLVAFAKTTEAHRHLCHQFEKHTVQKTYLALIIGLPAQEAQIITLPIAEDPKFPGRMIISHHHGKTAHTEFRIIEKFRNYSVAEVTPKTGRTHQIRVHFKAIGHPLAVDPLYGNARGIYLSDFKPDYRFKEGEPEKPLIARLTLHAASLRFQHTNGEMITVQAELPKDFRSVINHLRKSRTRTRVSQS